jgi:hypothetical protein
VRACGVRTAIYRRSFVDWARRFAASAGPVLAVSLSRSRFSASYAFERLNPAVTVTLGDGEISLDVVYQGEQYVLFATSASFAKVGRGYVDEDLLPDYRKIHADLRSLWEEGTLGELGIFFTERFFVARYLVVHRQWHGLQRCPTTWVSLAEYDDRGGPYEIERLPLWREGVLPGHHPE